VNEVSNLLTYVVVKIPATPSNVCDAFFLGGVRIPMLEEQFVGDGAVG